MRLPLRSSLLTLALAGLMAACSGGDSTSPGKTPVLTSILLVATKGTIVVGDTMRMRADAKDQNGSPITASVTWSSSAQGVATVSTSGLVTAMAPGSTTITAASGSVRATPLTVTVIASGGGYPLTAEVFMPGNVFSPFVTDIARTGVVSFIFPPDPHNVIWVAAAGVPADIDILSSTTRTRQFNAVGTFTYNCVVHPGMTGIVIVH